MFLNPGSEGGGGREWRRPWRSNGEGRVWGGRGSVFIWGRKGSQRERRWLWPFIPALHSRLPGQQSSLILSAVGVHICSCLLRDMSRLCSISILIFLAVFITWRHELSTLWLCSPPPCTLKSLNCPPHCRSTCGEDQEAVQAQKIWKKSIMLVWRAAANHRWRLLTVYCNPIFLLWIEL